MDILINRRCSRLRPPIPGKPPPGTEAIDEKACTFYLFMLSFKKKGPSVDQGKQILLKTFWSKGSYHYTEL